MMNVKNKNRVLRYFGVICVIISIILNVKMFIEETWPTYLFLIICIIGLFQIIISFIIRELRIGWQIFLILFPFILSFILLKSIE